MAGDHHGWRVPAGILALTLFLAPVLGSPIEEVLQDTLKSFIVAAGVFTAALAYFLLPCRDRRAAWHGVLWLPLLLLGYALSSLLWSHAYLAAVEAARWAVLFLLAWLALNAFVRERLPLLAMSVFAAATVASLWAALQFWSAVGLFPQGRHPASTFVNRNFFAEYLVCALPFGAIVVARARTPLTALLAAHALGLQSVALMMTAARGAMGAAALQLVVLACAGWRFRRSLPAFAWPRRLRLAVPAVLLLTVVAFGLVPSANEQILREGRGRTAIERVLQRSWGMGGADDSMGVRQAMWRATLRMIQAQPLTGVGAGAWENDIPLYQNDEAQVETDYYAHNEYLQLVAEYGVAGWLFLAALLAWLARAAWRTLGLRRDDAEAAWRATLLASLGGLFVVSLVGFPWRLAATGAMLAVCVGALAASERRLAAAAPVPASRRIPFAFAGVAACGAAVALALSCLVGWQATQAEFRLVGAARLALSLSATGRPMDPRLAQLRNRVQRMALEGVRVNPHYRKLTPIVADELASWGEWEGAVLLWESVLQSRPHVVAMMANVAQGYIVLGQPERAAAWLEAARQVNPNAPALRDLEQRFGLKPAHASSARDVDQVRL